MRPHIALVALMFASVHSESHRREPHRPVTWQNDYLEYLRRLLSDDRAPAGGRAMAPPTSPAVAADRDAKAPPRGRTADDYVSYLRRLLIDGAPRDPAVPQNGDKNGGADARARATKRKPAPAARRAPVSGAGGDAFSRSAVKPVAAVTPKNNGGGGGGGGGGGARPKAIALSADSEGELSPRPATPTSVSFYASDPTSPSPADTTAAYSVAAVPTFRKSFLISNWNVRPVARNLSPDGPKSGAATPENMAIALAAPDKTTEIRTSTGTINSLARIMRSLATHIDDDPSKATATANQMGADPNGETYKGRATKPTQTEFRSATV